MKKWPSRPATRSPHGLPTAVATDDVAAISTVPLDRRRAFYDLMASIAHDRRNSQPFARACGAGECDLGGDLASRLKYTAGSGPPEPLRA